MHQEEEETNDIRRLDMTWTPMDEITRVGVKFLNGEYAEVDVNAIIHNGTGIPLWLTYHDKESREVIIFFNVVQTMTVLGRRINVNEPTPNSS